MVAMELTSLNYFYESCFMDLQGEDNCPHHFPQNRFQWIPNSVVCLINFTFYFWLSLGRIEFLKHIHYSDFCIDFFFFVSDIKPTDYYEPFELAYHFVPRVREITSYCFQSPSWAISLKSTTTCMALKFSFCDCSCWQNLNGVLLLGEVLLQGQIPVDSNRVKSLNTRGIFFL